MAPGARVPVFGRCACCCWGTLLATRRCLGDCSRGGGPRADGQRQSNAAQREQSTAKQRPSTARLQSFYFAARLAAAPGVQASRAGSVRLPRTAAGTQPPPGKSSKRARLGQGVRAKFTQHSEAHANQRRHSRPGPSIMLGAGVRRAFRGGATTEVASAAISVINQRALQVAPTTNRDRPRAPA
jgi:hypothetical protein